MPTEQQCVLGATNETRVTELEKKMDVILEELSEIKEKLLGRPTWLVLFIFTAMASTIASLVVAQVT